MSISKGCVVSLSYYTGMHAFYSHVVSVHDGGLGIAFHPEFVKSKFMEDDPIVLSYELNEELFTCECTIATIDLKQESMQLTIDHKQSIQNNRLFERFPVSLYASIYEEDIKHRTTGIVKNISMTGLSIIGKKEYKVGSFLHLDLYLDERVIPLRGRVAWNKKNGSKIEYGLITEYPDYTVKNTIKLYLDILKEEQKINVQQRKLQN